ncbi:exo-alpha-sialidase [Pedobacter sp. Leaf194]|uniref:sialidase family protein n=1 Tax=Pedobacter sp. Leaf194 TaxID=1736297 RepID=UPI0007035EF4|nr:sialidase family protein [Pedobacter sp. Leaf194]KQS35715.1 sialidase [Pedobacter sp. Leaf194]
MLKLKIYITSIVVFAFAINANAQVEKWQNGVVTQEFLYDKAPFPSCHSATIAETPTGLVASFFGGTKERNPDVEIYISRLVNGKWLAPVSVADGIQPAGKRLPTWNPVLYQIPGGDLLLFYKIGPKPSEWWGMMKTSKDGGISWSEATKLPDGYIGPVKNKPVLLSNGNLFAPSSKEGDGWKIHFEVTKDNGKTWRMVGPLPENGIKAIQPSILQHGNGKLQILARTANRAVVESWSEDNGETWSALTKTSLPNNNSGTDAVTLKDGRHVLVYNHVLPPGDLAKGARTPLNVSVSKDGKNWYAALILEDAPISQYSYPAVIQTADGMLHFIYTWRREKIKHVVVDPSKLKLKKIKNGVWPQLKGYKAPVITETKSEEP